MNIQEKLKSGRLYLDGGMGTLLQARGLKPGELPELWSLSHPDIIENIHCEYLKSGCDVISTNTFGANSLKFGEKNPFAPLEDIIAASVNIARRAADKFSTAEKKFVALDIGPTGRLLKPLGDLDFEDAVAVFSETIRLGVKYGVDLILIETMNDCYETRAAVIAAKENCNLPVFVSNAYDESGKLMTGASPSAMVAMLEGLRVDALGINCSLGPDKMEAVVSELIEYSSTPVIVAPNAGLPVIRDGKTDYDLTPELFGESMLKIAQMGAQVLGGCCGTTPKHIQTLINLTKNLSFEPLSFKNKTLISSYTHCLEFKNRPVLIGERINPTGKPKLKAALRENNLEYILQEGISQQDLGADALDVNVGLPEIDEAEMLSQVIFNLQSVTNLPLQIDTANISAMEKALRIYNGKPLINSVNGKRESMESVLPLAAKYGGTLIALTLDESGIPETVDGRIAIANRIIDTAAKYGIDRKDIIVDPLAMTISSDSKAALTTLECIERLTEMGIKTSLGVSNISFGLPERGIINSTFFTMAMQRGLSAAIMNPHSKEMTDAYYGFCAISSLDLQCEKYIEYALKKQQTNAEKSDTTATVVSPDTALKKSVLKGLREDAATYANELLKTDKPLDIIDKCIIPALDEIGIGFERKTVFLPQLLMSAEAAKSAFEVIREHMSKSGGNRRKKMKIVLATVKGDIHDIGKNIVKTLLENYDFDVIDLGKDVAPELVVEAAEKSGAPLVGLSALMTTTVPAMQETIELLKSKLPSCRVVVGGAVLTQEYADMIGADKYSKDAMETVRYAESLNI